MTHRTSETEQVIDFGEARAQRIEEKRRKTERVFFKNLLSVYCVVGEGQMHPIELVEVSEEGCSFQVPFDAKRPWPTEAKEMPVRLYFSQDTYLTVCFQIQNSRPCVSGGSRYLRFGCSVDKTTSTYPAYLQFVRFLKLYAEHAHKDKGDLTVFYI